MVRLLLLCVTAVLLSGCQTYLANLGPASNPKLAATGWRQSRGPVTVPAARASARVENALVCALPACGGPGGVFAITYTGRASPARISLGQFAQTVQLSNQQLTALLKLNASAAANVDSALISNVRRTGDVISFDFTCEPKAALRMFATGHAKLTGDTMVVHMGIGTTSPISRERLALASRLH
jgi:hypothetical protein